MTHPNDTTANVASAYMAGLFEGEGSIHFYRPSHSPNARIRIEVGISMTDREPLALFCRLAEYGRVRGPYLRKDGYKPMYSWKIVGAEPARALYGRMAPWLSPRRVAAFEAALSAYDESVAQGYGNGSLAAKLRRVEFSTRGKSGNPCTGCGVDRSEKTPGCAICYKRWWQRAKSAAQINGLR